MKQDLLVSLFRYGSTTGKASNMFIEGDTIYSYGYHFPIAKRINNGFLYNPETYSAITSKQQSLTFGCLYGKVIHLNKCDINFVDKQFKSNLNKITHHYLKLIRCRKRHKYHYYMIKWYERQNKMLKDFKRKYVNEISKTIK